MNEKSDSSRSSNGTIDYDPQKAPYAVATEKRHRFRARWGWKLQEATIETDDTAQPIPAPLPEQPPDRTEDVEWGWELADISCRGKT